MGSFPSAARVPAAVLSILRCVACNSTGLRAEGNGGLTCPNCGRDFVTKNGVPDLTPAHMLPLPNLYDDPDYRKWLAFQAKSKAYFYRPGSLMAWIQNAGHRAIHRMRAGDTSGKVVLDLGSGDGHHCTYLRPDDCYFGLDLDQNSLERARERWPDQPVMRADACNLPLTDAAVDTIVNVYNLEHIIHLDFALQEMARVLKPDGTAYIALPTEGSLAWMTGRRVSTGRVFAREGMDYMRAQEIDHINCIWQLDKAIRRHFHVVRQEFFPNRVPSFHLNLIITYKCTQRPERR